MVSRFAFRVHVHPGNEPAAGGNPMLNLLYTLRGRQVTVIANGERITGKVVTANPLILADATGQVTVVTPGAIQSVQF